ncbi:hypothetical protein GQ55_5G048700 [Panicum hallii var. hallii]|uniref:Uncharacterized protein n=1 Tax=Panicum hallii var. hallii TaxID=1504633 RepID=A0A2T7DCS2_9POAL|nr:hypothetical protein GQ55_5G048700 [Panicum hallii var. hallii]
MARRCCVSTAELVLGDEAFDELLHSALDQTCLVIETSICGVCSLDQTCLLISFLLLLYSIKLYSRVSEP